MLPTLFPLCSQSCEIIGLSLPVYQPDGLLWWGILGGEGSVDEEDALMGAEYEGCVMVEGRERDALFSAPTGASLWCVTHGGFSTDPVMCSFVSLTASAEVP